MYGLILLQKIHVEKSWKAGFFCSKFTLKRLKILDMGQNYPKLVDIIMLSHSLLKITFVSWLVAHVKDYMHYTSPDDSVLIS